MPGQLVAAGDDDAPLDVLEREVHARAGEAEAAGRLAGQGVGKADAGAAAGLPAFPRHGGLDMEEVVVLFPDERGGLAVDEDIVEGRPLRKGQPEGASLDDLDLQVHSGEDAAERGDDGDEAAFLDAEAKGVRYRVAAHGDLQRGPAGR